MVYKTTKIYYASHCLELTEDPAVENSVQTVWASLPQLRDQHLAATEGHIRLQADEAEQTSFLDAYSALFSYVETGGGVVEREDESLLLIRRKGVWDLPKGKLETDEGLLDAAMREITEETGVTGMELVAPLPNTYHIYQEKGQWMFKTGYWFALETDYDGPLQPQTEEDITEVHWMPKRELNLDTLDTYPGIRNLLRVYFDRFPPL